MKLNIITKIKLFKLILVMVAALIISFYVHKHINELPTVFILSILCIIYLTLSYIDLKIHKYNAEQNFNSIAIKTIVLITMIYNELIFMALVASPLIILIIFEIYYAKKYKYLSNYWIIAYSLFLIMAIVLRFNTIIELIHVAIPTIMFFLISIIKQRDNCKDINV